MRREQLRIGETFNCRSCFTQFYAAPSRAKRLHELGYGYCSSECFYRDLRKPRTKCPVCELFRVKRPNRYCSSFCYHEHRRQDKRYSVLHVFGEVG